MAAVREDALSTQNACRSRSGPENFPFVLLPFQGTALTHQPCKPGIWQGMMLSHWSWEQMQMHQLEQVRLQHSGSRQSIPTLASSMVTQRKCSWR